MRILVPIRQVPDAEATVRVAAGKVDLADTKLVLDTMDEYGLEQALRMRDADPSVEVIALAIGPARCDEALRTALAMGADRAILVETPGPLDVIATSDVVAQIARTEAIDLILCGGQQADWDSQALGPATAERLAWPQATWTHSLNALDCSGQTRTGRHDVDDGSQSFTLSLPAVITTQQGLNDPRYPTLPNIIKARKKELRRDPLDLYHVTSRVQLVSAEMQKQERLHIRIDTTDLAHAAAELVAGFREAKVLA